MISYSNKDNLTPLPEFRKQMLVYAKANIELEEGETARKWVNKYVKALEQDGKICKIRGKLYVID